MNAFKYWRVTTNVSNLVVVLSIECRLIDHLFSFCSELVSLESTVVLNLAEPEVVSGLGLVPSVRADSSSKSKVACYGSVEHKVDSLEFEASAAASHSVSFLFLLLTI